MHASQIRGRATPARAGPSILRAPHTFSLALLGVRLVIGALFIGHGLQKTAGWFGGDGFVKWTDTVAQMGLRPAALWASLEAGAEIGAGVLLVAGLLTSVAAAVLIADMLVATVKVHLAKGLWSQQGGFEYNLVLATVLVALAIAGPGFYSVDRRIGLLRWRIALFVAAALACAIVVGYGLRG